MCEKHANTANENRTAASALGMVKVRPVDARVRWRIPSETDASGQTERSPSRLASSGVNVGGRCARLHPVWGPAVAIFAAGLATR
jgi:hypothetical protein